MNTINKFTRIVFAALFVVMLTVVGGTANAHAHQLPAQIQQQSDINSQIQAKLLELQQINAQIRQLNHQMIALRAQLVPGQPNTALVAQIAALQAQIDQLSSLAQVVMFQLQALLKQR